MPEIRLSAKDAKHANYSAAAFHLRPSRPSRPEKRLCVGRKKIEGNPIHRCLPRPTPLGATAGPQDLAERNSRLISEGSTVAAARGLSNRQRDVLL